MLRVLGNILCEGICYGLPWTAALVRFDYIFFTSLIAYRGGPIVTCNDLYKFKGGGGPKFFRGGGALIAYFYGNLLHLIF